MRYGSVCSGIEAATVAWHPLGWTPVFFSEIDAFPCAVLQHYFPDVPNRGDMTKFKDWPDATIDVLVGGTPCQSFSVAGLRKGLDDPRGNLMLTFGAIASRYRPQWVVWENVPGVLSSNEGRDFGSFLGMLGVIGYGFAYRVLDAQFFGLAQRRKRVFVVGCLGDWRRAAAVLFERHSLSGHPAPRREAGQGTAPRAAAGAGERGVVGTIGCNTGPRGHGFGDFLNNQAVDAGHLVAFGGNKTSGARDVASALSAHGGTGRHDFETETFVTHSLRGEGFDASEDGTGRSTPLVPVAYAVRTANTNANGHGVAENVTHTLDQAQGQCIAFDARQSGVIQYGDKAGPLDTCGFTMGVLAFSAKDHGADATSDLAPTLRAMPHDGSHANGGGQVAVALHENQRAEVTLNDTAGSLKTSGGKPGQGYPAVMAAMQVRRLTPRECERLQGFPDDYLDIEYRGKPAADGPKYKALGNSFAVPVVRWIGERIQMVEQIKAEAA